MKNLTTWMERQNNKEFNIIYQCNLIDKNIYNSILPAFFVYDLDRPKK